MRASTEKVSFFGGGWGERVGDGWRPHLKHKKPKKNCARRAYERATLRNFLKKAKNKHEGFYTPFFLVFGSSEILDAGVRFFSYCCCLIRDWRGEEMI